MTPADRRALREKYAELVRLRELHEHAKDEPDPRAAMAVLAERFPGALREVDVRPMGELRARLAALDAGAVEPWMLAQARFHDLARSALAAKRALGKGKRVTAELCAAHPGWDLARVASPPRGRILDLVFAALAVELGITEREARQLVFGSTSTRTSRASKKA